MDRNGSGRHSDIVIDQLREIRKDIKSVHEEVHALEISFTSFKVSVKSTVSIISILMASGVSMVTTFFRGH